MSLLADGYEIAPRAVSSAVVEELRDEMARLAERAGARRQGAVYGIRRVLKLSPTVRNLAGSEQLLRLVRPALGAGIHAVRGIFFDKTPAANWPLPWHQDRVIAVKARSDLPGFRNWTVKHGAHHVEPPLGILRSMVTLRLHLDACGPENGALQVISGRHEELMDADTLARFRGSDAAVTCAVGAVDAVLMRPLTPHSSDKSRSEARRRVLHIEYAAAMLPPPLEWDEAA